MIPDFLWQQALLFVLGSGSTKAVGTVRHRLTARRMRRFLGNGRDSADVTLVLQVLSPLSRSNFAGPVGQTVAVKELRDSAPERVTIHADVIHLNDFLATQQLWELFRAHRVGRIDIHSDLDWLGQWQSHRQIVCLGSPNHNAVTAEAIALAHRPGTAMIRAVNDGDTLDSYRVLIEGPAPVELGVTQDLALGVIARLPHPQDPRAWVIAIWGCRAESTLATVRFLSQNFRAIARSAKPDQPFTAVLAIRGRAFGVAEPMYVAADEVLLQDAELLQKYTRISP